MYRKMHMYISRSAFNVVAFIAAITVVLGAFGCRSGENEPDDGDQQAIGGAPGNSGRAATPGNRGEAYVKRLRDAGWHQQSAEAVVPVNI